mgnify:CR=1 FL=1
MRLTEVTAYHNRTSQILTEGYQDLTESQKIYLNRYERELWPLMEELTKAFEATLTADQIKSIFAGAEKAAVDSGSNQTMLGKAGSGVAAVAKLPVKLAKAVDAKVNELGRLAQKAGPVKNMDAKFEELKKKIGDSDSKIAAGVKKVSDWAKANPGKASLAVGILTAVAAFAGGPAGGAAAGLLLRSTNELLKGEKLSTAVGKSLKTAAYGALAGMAFRYISDQVLDNVMTVKEAEWVAMEEGYMDANLADAKAEIAGKFGLDNVDTALDGAARYQLTGNYNAFYYDYDVIIAPEQRATFNALKDAVANTESFSDAQIKATMKFHDFLQGLVDNPENQKLAEIVEAIKNIPQGELTSAQTNALMAASDNIDKLYDTIENAGKAGAAAIQGAAQTVDAKKENAVKSKAVDPQEMKQLELDFEKEKDKKESIDYEETVEYLYEQFLLEKDPRQGELKLDNPNSLGAKFKRGLGKVGSKISGGAKSAIGGVKSVGKELGNVVTQKKLMKAWTQAGEPTDTGSIYNILNSFGLSDDMIGQIGQQNKVSIAPTKDAPKGDAKSKTDPASKNAGKGADKTGAPKDAKQPGLMNRMAGVQKDGHTWQGGQWVNDETGKIGSTDKLGNPFVDALAKEIKDDGPDVIAQVQKMLGGDAPAKKTAAKKPPATKTAPKKPAPKKAPKKKPDMSADVNKDGKVSPDEQSRANYAAGMDRIRANSKKKPNAPGSKTLQKKSKNPKAKA